MKLKGSGGLARIQIKDNFDELLLFIFLIISFTVYFLTNSDHFHDWHCVISGFLSFMFPCILSQEFPRSLHFYITNTGRKVWTENTFLSILPSTDFILYFQTVAELSVQVSEKSFPRCPSFLANSCMTSLKIIESTF